MEELEIGDEGVAGTELAISPCGGAAPSTEWTSTPGEILDVVWVWVCAIICNDECRGSRV